MRHLPSPNLFLSKIFNDLKSVEIDISNYFLDHICYRVETQKKYRTLKSTLEKENQLLIESEINGRNISVFKLKNPIKFEGRSIPLLELPAPKTGSHYTDGWEHIEFVIDESLDLFLEKNQNLTFDKKGFSKPINRDIRLKLGKLSVKFHEMSLEEVIQIEKSE